MLLRRPLEGMYAYPLPPVRPQAASARLSDVLPIAAESVSSIYVHVPFCLTFCHFCGFIKSKYSKRAANDYVDALCSDIDRVGAVLRPEIDAIYFGGGTASTLSSEQVRRIVRSIRNSFNVRSSAEFTFEGEATSLSKPGYLSELKETGVTRLSFGVQTVDPHLRAALNLRPKIDLLAELGRKAETLFGDVCIDLITGWPGVPVEKQLADVQEAIHAIDVASVEIFLFEPLDASPKLIKGLRSAFQIPIPLDIAKSLDLAIAKLLDNAGRRRLSYSVFSKNGRPDSLADFTYYHSYYGWNHGNILGFGCGAQSFYSGLMWGETGSLDDFVRFDRRSERLIRPFQYDRTRKALATWPRRGRVAADIVSRADASYRRKIDQALKAGIIGSSSSELQLRQQYWYLTPLLMHTLLSKPDQEQYEAISDERARQRGLNRSIESIHAL